MKVFPVCMGFNVVVIAVIVALAVVLGILNNSRVYEEQQVPIFGDSVSGDEAE